MIRPLLKREIGVINGYVLIHDLQQNCVQMRNTVDLFITHLGVPSEIHPDQGSKLFKEMCQLLAKRFLRRIPSRMISFFKCSMVSFDCIWLKSSFKPSVPKTKRNTHWFHSSQETFPDCLPSLVLVTSNLKGPRNFFYFFQTMVYL